MSTTSGASQVVVPAFNKLVVTAGSNTSCFIDLLDSKGSPTAVTEVAAGASYTVTADTTYRVFRLISVSGDFSYVVSVAPISEIASGTFSTGLTVAKTSGVGIKVDTAAPTFGWADMLGIVTPRASAPNAASLDIYRGGTVREWSFALNDVSDNRFHIPHDYVPGSDLYLHVHWSHNGTAISGNMVFTVAHTYAKGYNQAAFYAEKTLTLSMATPDVTTVPRYQHQITEVQLSSSSPSAGQIDNAVIEVDGLILVNVAASTIPTITGGSPNNPFVHCIDLHYQTTGIAGTKQKNGPAFYT